MLGNGVALPGDCKLASANLEKTTIKATYACSSGEVVVELAHPANAPTDSTRTEKFALRLERGTAPPDLQSALLSRIRELESQFQWAHATASPRTEPTAPSGTAVLGLLVLGLLVLAALLLRRRRTVATRD